MRLTALVADDERLARDELCFLLAERDVEVVGRAANGPEAVSLAESLEPDVVFLDIQMPGLTGFEAARQMVNKQLPVELVFVTAYDQHAIEAFEVNAVDYLLKPVDVTRLEQALSRVERRLAAEPERRPARLSNDDLERLVQRVTGRQAQRDQLALKVGERVMLIRTDEVVYASLEHDTITIVASGVTGTSSYRTLDELQGHLDSEVFWRVHRSHIVNINKIKEIVPWFSRNYLLRMRDAKSTEIPVSRAQTKRLREYLRL